MISPVRITPHAGINLSKLYRSTRIVLNSLLEGAVEVAIVQKYVRIIEPSIEMPLDRFDRLDHPFELLVPSEYNKK